ncbi:DUF924 family protein [Croceicoccus sp. F390]|uniref:DUF924 family protein n=1 Tax=Croceicoccus esteveae TaxID=3075597 RepID=A0ABU2ZFM0_9SPHN|nr:DUF924 family protein [Croceicoccus sp. F390]MDT0575397.1 DUF924 family protein [Croceicoccus sp. F390]
MALASRRWAAELLHVWFHKLDPEQWFSPDAGVDHMLQRRFGQELAMLSQRPAAEFLSAPDTTRAAILLFDQVSRNVHRGSPDAFKTDALALSLAGTALHRRWDLGLSRVERQFLAMPFMHSEQIADQRRSLELFTAMDDPLLLHYARSHYRMIARFGRFPHRNAVLGRISSAAERRAVAAGNAW